MAKLTPNYLSNFDILESSVGVSLNEDKSKDDEDSNEHTDDSSESSLFIVEFLLEDFSA